MKQAALLIACIAITSFCFANKISHDSSSLKVISLQDMLYQIEKIIRSDEHYELKKANVLNIETKLTHKKRVILYNPTFITDLNNASKNNWSVIALLAHEIGHHVKGHTSHKGGSKPQLELEADEFAGYILNKLGATVEQSQNVMYFIASTTASKTHPSRKERLLAIEKGWNEAEDSIDGRAATTISLKGFQDLH